MSRLELKFPEAFLNIASIECATVERNYWEIMLGEGTTTVGPLMSQAIRLLNVWVTKFVWLRNLFRGDDLRIAKPPTRDWDQHPLNKFSNPINLGTQ